MSDTRCDACKYKSHQCMECALVDDQVKLDAMLAPGMPGPLPPRMTVMKDEVHFGPGSDPLAFPDTVDYLSLEEHEQLLRDAREMAFRLCLRFVSMRNYSLEDIEQSIRNEMEAARKETP